MNKKLLIALTSLAVVLSCTALGLWWTVKGKNEAAMRHTQKLTPRFSTPGVPEFDSRMTAIDKSHATLVAAEAEIVALKEDLAAKRGMIEQQTRKIKDLEATVTELDGKLSDVTRTKDELQKKVEDIQSSLTKAESKVKDLENQIAKDAEEQQKKIEEMQAKFDADKLGIQNDVRVARDFYTKLYHFSTSRGLEPKWSLRPWDGVETRPGPKFASNSVISEIVACEQRLGFVVLNVGGDAGLLRDQVFDVYVSDVVVGRLRIGDILNGSVSSGYLMKGTDASKFAVGTPVKLIPIGGVTQH